MYGGQYLQLILVYLPALSTSQLLTTCTKLGSYFIDNLEPNNACSYHPLCSICQYTSNPLTLCFIRYHLLSFAWKYFVLVDVITVLQLITQEYRIHFTITFLTLPVHLQMCYQKEVLHLVLITLMFNSYTLLSEQHFCNNIYLVQCPQKVHKHGHANKQNGVHDQNHRVVENILIFGVAECRGISDEGKLVLLIRKYYNNGRYWKQQC